MALAELRYFSPALGKQTAAFVALPDPSVAGPTHVLLLLHGLSDDYSIWQRRTSIERYVEGLPLMVVMPDGGRGFYCDAAQGYAYGTALGLELPNMIDHWFRPEGKWSVAGLSMGGYGAVRLALGNSERFVAAVSHSGALGFGHRGEYLEDRGFGAEMLRILGTPEPGGPHDLYRLVKETTPLPAIRIDCGTEDFLLQDNRDFRDHLVSLGIPHEYEEHPGAHEWGYWDSHVQESIGFVRKTIGF